MNASIGALSPLGEARPRPIPRLRPRGQRIAIVGTGISGLMAAHLLHPHHELTVFEAGEYAGGHTNTIDIDWQGRRFAVDTGFIVFNHRTYPHFVRLLDDLGVASQPTEMSFSVRCERTGLEYGSRTLDSLFAQRRNLLRPSFLRMVRDILRFHRQAPELLAADDDTTTLGEYLERQGYGPELAEHHVIPMGAAIWSAGAAQMRAFPARNFVQFFANHGLLQVDGQPRWRVVRGGSRRYVDRLIEPFRHRLRLRTPIDSIRRLADRVEVRTRRGTVLRFDHVVLATHGDTALRLLDDPTAVEREVLGAFSFQRNDAVLHTDDSVLPRSRRARAAWNYHILPAGDGRVAVTYDMNVLQSLEAPVRFLVTLNHDDAIDPAKVLRRIPYEHPILDAQAVAAQRRHAEISGAGRTSYCGAYWGYGFHEDGVRSALAACAPLIDADSIPAAARAADA